VFGSGGISGGLGGVERKKSGKRVGAGFQREKYSNPGEVEKRDHKTLSLKKKGLRTTARGGVLLARQNEAGIT